MQSLTSGQRDPGQVFATPQRFFIWQIQRRALCTSALSRRVDFRHASGHARLQRHRAAGLLRATDFDTLYIVGDLIDIWSLRRAIYWPQPHNGVIQKILRKTRKGTRVIYIPGNHDELVTSFCGTYGNIEIKENAIHVTSSGERILIIHGHELDVVVSGSGHMRWLAFAGDLAINFSCRSIR
jgi:UDP-2,3-diacylglucosamine pyrophosphatase LpxH